MKNKPERWIFIGIPVLFLIGSLMHFLYQFSGRSIIVGAIAPANESVWEHLKMVPIPVAIWWTCYYLLTGEKHAVDPNKWFAGALVALVTALVTIPILFYFYTEAFGIHLLVLDVIILLIAIIVGQLLGLYVYKNTNGIPYAMSLAIMIGILVLFVIFTFYPPHIPLFKDSTIGKYGISPF